MAGVRLRFRFCCSSRCTLRPTRHSAPVAPRLLWARLLRPPSRSGWAPSTHLVDMAGAVARSSSDAESSSTSMGSASVSVIFFAAAALAPGLGSSNSGAKKGAAVGQLQQ